jgi:hypothetical protein
MAGTAVGDTRVPLALKQSLSYRVRLATEFFAKGELSPEWEDKGELQPLKPKVPLAVLPKTATISEILYLEFAQLRFDA